jgi:hypothetical protein
MVIKIGTRLTQAIHDGPADDPAAATSPPLATRAQANSKNCVIRSSDDRRHSRSFRRGINAYPSASPSRRLQRDNVTGVINRYAIHAHAIIADTNRCSFLSRISLASA